MDAKDIVLDFDVKEVPSNGINPRANRNNRQDSTPQHFVDSNQGILSAIKQYQNIALYLKFIHPKEIYSMKINSIYHRWAKV